MKDEKPNFILFSFLLILLFLLQLFSLPASAFDTVEKGDFQLKFSGYLKNIIDYSEPMDFPINLALGVPPGLFNLGDYHEPEYWDDLTRLRLRFETRYKKEWASEVQVEARGLAHRPDPFASFLGQSPAAQRWLNMDRTLYDEPGYKSTTYVDRLWVRWAPKWGEIIVGRQAITWTVGRLWFPMDRFGPFLPFLIEQDEKPGVDAVNMAINLGTLAEFRVIFAPLKNERDDRIGARIKADVRGFEFMVMGGYFGPEYVGGFGVSHAIRGALGRVEFSYSHPLDNRIVGWSAVPAIETLFPKRQTDRWSVIAGIDGSFGKKFYGVAEYYHQSGGQTSPDRYFESFPLYTAGKIFGLGQDYAGGVLRWSFRPEWSLTGLGILSMTDWSAVFSPQLEFDWRSNLKIVLATTLFIPSTSKSEFGLFPNAYYLSLKGYF